MPSGGHARAQPAGWRGILCTLLAGLMLGACASGSSPLSLEQPASYAAAHQAPTDAQSELDKAILYWGQQYSKNPRDKSAAISYARNLKASGQKQAAFNVLQQASVYHGNDRELASEYGRLALEFGHIGMAQKLLAIAHDPAKPDWRVISAQGTVLAKQGDYTGAIPYYERALRLAPDQPSLINNLAMALAADGQPEKAEPLLRRAVADQNADPKVRQNLVLVLGLQGKYDEAEQAGLAADTSVADADYLRRMTPSESTGPRAAFASAGRQSPALRPSVGADTQSDPASDGWTTRVAQAPRR